MSAQFAVVSKRVGQRVKRKLFATRKGADRRITLLGPEPWLAFGKEPDERMCCDGYMCGCYGATYRQDAESRRKELPPLEYVRLEVRELSEWQPVDLGPSGEVPSSVTSKNNND